MKLSTKIVWIISGVISFALIGLIWVQVSLLKRAYTLELRSFENNVNSALSAIVQELENTELLNTMVEIYLQDGDRALTLNRILSKNPMPVDSAGTISIFSMHERIATYSDTVSGPFGDSLRIHSASPARTPDAAGIPKVAMEERGLRINLDKPTHITVSISDSTGSRVKELVNTERNSGSHYFNLGDQVNGSSNRFLKVILDTTVHLLTPAEEISVPETRRPAASARKMFISTVASISDSTGMPLMPRRLDPVFLDSVITVTLEDAGLPSNVQYAVYSESADSLILKKPKSATAGIRQSGFSARLFPFVLDGNRDVLYLQFPGKRRFLMNQIVGIATTAFLFIVLLGAAFIFIIKLMLGQKRFSQSLIDFINNMTHEFKTPISTISLVSENMAKPEVLKDKKRLATYSRVIRDENMRMRGQVNKILQMAELEQGEVRLKQDRIDMHALISTVTDNFSIQAENSNGEIVLSLAAGHYYISGDRYHLMNILTNLLDNGLKYNTRSPRLEIATGNSGPSLTVTVADNGIGIASEHVRRIFDKYYRVPTGNLHDVKGFGLGLSYVKLMVEAHRGSISVSSRPGRGTAFTITLPVVQDD